MTAVLDASPGAVLSHSSALAWWGVPGFSLGPLHVVRPRGLSRQSSRLTRIHEVVDLLAHHVKVFDDVPVTSPARALFESAGLGLHPLRLARACDNAWAIGLYDGPTIHRTFIELAASGRNGTCLMRELLADRPVDYLPPASNLERRFQAILEEAGLPPMRRQVNSGGDEWVGRVDFSDHDLPLIVEVNSDRYHRALSDAAADERRRRALEEAGFEVVVVWENDVWHDKHKVLREVRAGRHRAFSRRIQAESA